MLDYISNRAVKATSGRSNGLPTEKYFRCAFFRISGPGAAGSLQAPCRVSRTAAAAVVAKIILENFILNECISCVQKEGETQECRIKEDSIALIQFKSKAEKPADEDLVA